MRALLRITSAVAVLTMVGGADASLLNSDDFSYVGALTDNGWVAHSGAGNKVVMADGSLATLEQSEGSGEDVSLGFAAQGATDTIFAAFDFSLPSADNADNLRLLDGNGLYFAHFKDSGFSFRGRTGIIQAPSGGDFGLAINADSSDLGAGATWPSDLSFDIFYRVVISWDASTGDGRLWLDPASEDDLSIFHTGTNSGELIEAFALRQSNDYTGMITIDNVLAGETFLDVIPEPATLALLGAGGLVLLRRRR